MPRFGIVGSTASVNRLHLVMISSTFVSGNFLIDQVLNFRVNMKLGNRLSAHVKTSPSNKNDFLKFQTDYQEMVSDIHFHLGLLPRCVPKDL